ncbi:MAG TPA: FMN-binding protein, partial [Ghiorsea sp.]|nr:FMN-binding protein [Ghiorsea sp.]
MRFLLLLVLSVWSLPAQADIYLEPQAFVKQQFAGNAPQAKVIWLNKTLKAKLADILKHEYAGLRVRYWQGGQRTVWVLNEIGKEKNITVGITIEQGKIRQLQVLAFRESRGWEVKHDFFTRQFLSLFL